MPNNMHHTKRVKLKKKSTYTKQINSYLSSNDSREVGINKGMSIPQAQPFVFVLRFCVMRPSTGKLYICFEKNILSRMLVTTYYQMRCQDFYTFWVGKN
jgi:hypothetical protein